MFKGLKFNIISALIVVVGLGMVMTVVVIAVFWQRDILRKEVAKAQSQLSLLSRFTTIKDCSPGVSFRNKKKIEFVIKETGALAGLLYTKGSNTIVPDSVDNARRSNLQRLVQAAVATGKKQHALFGSGWGVFLPGNKYLGIAVPIKRHDQMVGAVGVVVPLAPVYASLAGVYRIIFVYLMVNLIVLTVLGLFRFMTILVRPVEKLIRLTDSYEEEEGIPFLSSFQGGDEFGQLSRSLNKMLERIERDREKMQSTVQSLKRVNKELIDTRKEVIRAEKLASVGRLAAGLAHEIGNPIGVVFGYLGLLKQQNLDPVERKDFAGRCERELQRINGLVRQLLDFSRVNSVIKERFSLHELLADILTMMESQPLMRSIEIRTDFTAQQDIIEANPDQIQQVFLNCFLNGVDAMVDCGDNEKVLTIATREFENKSDPETYDKDKTNKIEVCVTDTGTGIEEENIDSVFDPFFTTKEPGKGTGLGLSVAYSIVEGCGGTMKVKSGVGEGTTVIVEFPLA